jgi:hypothetical protein
LGAFVRVSKSPLQHKHDESRSLAASSSFASGSRNGIEIEEEDDIDGWIRDSEMGRLLQRKGLAYNCWEVVVVGG